VRIRRGIIPFAVAASTALTAACARQSAPSGGPVDRRPPVIVGVEPDTFARVEADGGSIRIRFDEAISESPAAGTLDQAVQVSPRTGEVSVGHRGDALEVKIEGGFVPGVVYRITVLPVMSRGNPWSRWTSSRSATTRCAIRRSPIPWGSS
jgi:hypothetical protein